MDRKRQIVLYEDESRKLKDVLALAKSEVHRPYPEYKYQWETEFEKFLENKKELQERYEDLQKRKAAYKKEAILSWIAIGVSLLCLISQAIMFWNTVNG